MNAFLALLRHPRRSLGRLVRARAVTATGLALAVLLLTSVAPASTLTPPAHAQAPLTMRINYQPALLAAPLMIAMDKRYFEQANINIEPYEIWTSPELIAAFASGNMDGAAGGMGPAQMNAISRGILNPRLISPLHTEKPPLATPLTVRKALWDSGEVWRRRCGTPTAATGAASSARSSRSRPTTGSSGSARWAAAASRREARVSRA